MSNMTEAIKLLDDAGVLDRIREDAQAERETERETLLAKLQQVEADDAAKAKTIIAEMDRAADLVARLEGELKAAKIELNRVTSERSLLGMSAQRLRAKLVRLADPRLDASILTIRDLKDKARQQFASTHERKRDPYTGSQRLIPVSNGDTIAEVHAACLHAIAKMEALKESSRPDNLQDLVDGMVNPIRDDVRRLFGV